MTEAVVSGEDTHCLFINNGDDLLTLKKVVSKKTNEDDAKQKLHKSVETNSSELNGNHNKTDSIHFDVDNTSSLEPNLEMDSVTDSQITIGSTYSHENQDSETDMSNENSNEVDVKNGEEDIQVNSIICPDAPYSPSDSVCGNDAHGSEDDNPELNTTRSPASFYNLSARAPLHSYKDLNTTFEDNVESEISINKRKRKFKDLAEQEQKPTKMIKLWNLMKYPFQKITFGTSTSEAEIIVERKNSMEPEPSEENVETNEEIDDTPINVNRPTFCNIM